MDNLLNNIISSKYRTIFVVCILFVLTSIEIFYCSYSIKNNIKDIKCSCSCEENFTIEEENITNVINPEYIYVDIKGEVNNPGVYMIPYNSRVSDLIESAGGLTKNANTRFINLSSILNDGEVVVIYSNDEIKKAQKNNTIVNTVYVDTPCVCEEVKNDACLIENNIVEDVNKKEETNSTNEIISDKVNINTANIEELTTLSGIGESKAKAIIKYRDENGLFKTIEDIVNVSGISETLFSKIKENITV